MTEHPLSLIDKAICSFDNALRSVSTHANTANRATPQPAARQNNELSDIESKHAAGLMRVNHTGEVCAQALYQGQALTAKLPEVREEMEIAAEEEIDHLVWCEKRLEGLNSHTSVLNPVWYGLSFGIGATAGLISDKISLGFVAATEEQVCKHLSHHLETLPENDTESRAIVEQMLIDEEKHGHTALEAGGYDFPAPVKSAMSLVSKAMTSLSYRI
ncbi:MAG: 2-polyprenyl-3-methyl-6-methoxy-1,4-benzoquinone monooxygenase [Agarilytica sp.]